MACGSGRLLHFFKERGYQQIEGIDVSTEQVRIARQVTATVTEGDALEFLRAHPNQFSVVIGIDIIEHFKKPEVLEFLDLAYGALRQGGRLILQTPNAGCPWGSELRYGDFTHEVGFNPTCLARLLRLCKFGGLAVREMGPVPLGYSWNSSVRCVAWRVIRMGLKLYNLAETGSAGNGVFSRVFLISGLKQE